MYFVKKNRYFKMYTINLVKSNYANRSFILYIGAYFWAYNMTKIYSGLYV